MINLRESYVKLGLNIFNKTQMLIKNISNYLISGQVNFSDGSLIKSFSNKFNQIDKELSQLTKIWNQLKVLETRLGQEFNLSNFSLMLDFNLQHDFL